MTAPAPPADVPTGPRTPPDRWLDLSDVRGDGLPRRGSRRGRGHVVALAAAAVLAALVGAGAAVAARPPTPPAPPPVVATVVLDSVVLEPVPTVTLVLHLDNLGTTGQRVVEARVHGGGVRDTAAPVGRDVAPADGLDVRLSTPLDCADGRAASDRVQVSTRVTASEDARSASVRPREVSAVAIGRAQRLGGLCAAADALLPDGWRALGRAVSWSLTGGVLDVTVSGLPADSTRVLWVEADGVTLPPSGMAPAAPEVQGGAARLRLDVPAATCADAGLRPVVPTGLQLNLATPTGIRAAYVPVGPSIAQWLMEAFVAACPARPGGPAATRTSGV